MKFFKGEKMSPYILIGIILAFISLGLAWWDMRSPGDKIKWKLPLSQICLSITQIGLFSWLLTSGQVQGLFFVLSDALIVFFFAGLIFWSFRLVKSSMKTSTCQN